MYHMGTFQPGLDVERLNGMMADRDLSPGELAELSGVKYDTIYKIRTASRPRTSAEILARLARALGCSVDYLVGLTNDPRSYVAQPLPDDVRKILGQLERMSPQRRKEAAAVIATLANVPES